MWNCASGVKGGLFTPVRRDRSGAAEGGRTRVPAPGAPGYPPLHLVLLEAGEGAGKTSAALDGSGGGGESAGGRTLRPPLLRLGTSQDLGAHAGRRPQGLRFQYSSGSSAPGAGASRPLSGGKAATGPGEKDRLCRGAPAPQPGVADGLHPVRDDHGRHLADLPGDRLRHQVRAVRSGLGHRHRPGCGGCSSGGHRECGGAPGA